MAASDRIIFGEDVVFKEYGAVYRQAFGLVSNLWHEQDRVRS